MDLEFEPGKNIAMKIPAHEYENTVRFYGDVLRFKELTGSGENDTPKFEFGDKVLWLDCMPGLTQSEIWLEVVASNVEEASDYLKEQGCYRRDEMGRFLMGLKPSGYRAHRISYIWFRPVMTHDKAINFAHFGRRQFLFRVA